MKKIIILTFSKVYNRGANLQAFSLMKTLERLGFKVEFLDIQLPRPKLSLRGRAVEVVNNCLASLFRYKHGFVYTKQYTSIDDLKNNPPSADYYFVGSDQVWNPDITNKLDPLLYFLNFVPEGKQRIAYAASFGKGFWNKTSQDEEIKNCLKKFKAVSVREKSGIDVCMNNFGYNDASLVLDPTLLIDDLTLNDLTRNTKTVKGDVFTYLLHSDNQTLRMVNFIYQIQLGANYKSNSLLDKLDLLYGVKSWLKKIAKSEVVITNSFHCMVFAILFKKNFIVIPPHENREARLLSLLNILGISDRYFSSLDDIEARYSSLKVLDYECIHQILSTEKEKSMNFILTALKD